ncbi:MAG TPA: DUF2335 domain-containing protein [Candidatus Eisenbacteria bacterium]|nr:DUF2335 domain-containing protein [Candidatus Eisenbacteria bacterium]
MTSIGAAFSGPLPPPAALQRYDAIIPDGAERIMRMAELQAAHRRALEERVTGGNVAAQARGQHYALVVVLAGMIGGFTLIAFGRQSAGLAAAFVPLAAVAAVFLHARRAQGRERRERLAGLRGQAEGPK